jgi:hypothetical protein
MQDKTHRRYDSGGKRQIVTDSAVDERIGDLA